MYVVGCGQVTASERSGGRGVGLEVWIFLQVGELNALNRGEADNVINKGDYSGDLLWEGVRLDGSDDGDTRLVDGTEDSKFRLQHFLRDAHGDVNKDVVLHIGELAHNTYDKYFYLHRRCRETIYPIGKYHMKTRSARQHQRSHSRGPSLR